MSDWQNIDVMSNPWFSSQDLGDGGISMGDGNGAGWFNWQSNPGFSLSDLGKFYTPEIQNGDSSSAASVDSQALNDFLKQNNYSLQTSGVPGTGFEGRRLFDNKSNQQIGDTLSVQMTPSMMESLAAGAGMAALNPFGGLSGIGGGFSPGIGGALSSGISTFGRGGNLGDVFKSGAIGGLTGGYMPDVANLAGVTNPDLSNIINGASRGALSAGLQGGDIGQGAFMGAIPAAGNAVGDYISGMPDVGTIGGNMSDVDGETSATLGGNTTPTQYAANSQAMSVDPMLKLSNNTSADSGGGVDLMSSISNLFGFGSGHTGDMLQGLASLYLANRQRKMAKDFRNQIAGNRGAYEQQLQSSLARRDAASGRRSNYAGREVELQANLAKLDSQNAPAFAQLQQMETGGLMNMLNSGLVTGQRMGWWGSSPTPSNNYTPTSSTLPSLSSLGSQTPQNPYSLMEDSNRRRLLGGS